MVARDKKKIGLGIDVGSMTLKVAVIDEANNVLYECCKKHYSRIRETLLEALKELSRHRSLGEYDYAAVTGSGRGLVCEASLLPGINEIVAQAKAVSFYYPQTRTIIEIGGEDSKYIALDPDGIAGTLTIVDQRMNDVCAAGTGVFIEKQAEKMHIPIERFSELSIAASNPAVIAGRCTVFAKTDVTNLQQKGIPPSDIACGIANAVARNYIAQFSRGSKFKVPIVFQGGVAANKGAVMAFRTILNLSEGDLLVPEHFITMPAIGAAIMAREYPHSGPLKIEYLIEKLEKFQSDNLSHAYRRTTLPKLKPYSHRISSFTKGPVGRPQGVYVGIDVGSISTCVALLNEEKKIVAKSYMFNKGSLIDSVNAAFAEIRKSCGRSLDTYSIRGAGVTGSGKYLISEYVGADIVKDEITAQVKAAVEIMPDVDTVFEIGGQDSKYMQIENGRVGIFEMNKVCAAGTGSFLQEQAERLKERVENFSKFALKSNSPIDMGTRCTVLMESDLVHHQQHGASKEDIIAGLSYSVARNYLEKIVGIKPIGKKVLVLGGVAFNEGVIAAFEELLKRPLFVPEYHEITGAIGMALLVRDKMTSLKQDNSKFRGFNITNLHYTTSFFQCKDCPNTCTIGKVEKENGVFHYGGICGKHEVKKSVSHQPNLFKKREDILLNYWQPGRNSGNERIGITRTLLFFEYFPLWCVFLQELGCQVVISDPTTNEVINAGLMNTAIDNCFPNKVVYGHIENLKRKKVDKIFMPSVIEFERRVKDLEHNYSCMFVQTIANLAAYATPIEFINPVITRDTRENEWESQFAAVGRSLGKAPAMIKNALKKARHAQDDFRKKCENIGKELLRLPRIDDRRVVVLLGKPYNVHDPRLNLHIVDKLFEMGVLPIPYDCLPLSEQKLPSNYQDMVWVQGQDLMRAARVILERRDLNPILLSNFACSTDSFTIKYLEQLFRNRPFLVAEVDEHTSPSALLVRCEAFLNTLRDTSADDFLKQSKIFTPYVYSPKHKHFKGILYVPHLFEVFRVFASAFSAFGVRTKFLPPHDEETERLGKKYCSGKECLTYTMVIGDVIRMTQDPEFDPKTSAFLLPNANIPCRFSVFTQGAQLVLKERFPEVTFIAPRTSLDTDEFTRKFGPQFARLVNVGILAMEFINKKLLQVRPYEVKKGSSDRVYVEGIKHVSRALSKSGLLQGPFFKALDETLKRFDSVLIDVSRERPLVGVIGYDYTRSSEPGGNDLIRHLESLGAEVWTLPLFGPYLDFARVLKPEIMLKRGRYFDYVYDMGKAAVQQFDTSRVNRIFKGRLKRHPEPDFDEMMRVASKYFDRNIEASLLIILAYAAHYIKSGVDGIAVFVGFHCVVHSIASAAIRPVMDEYGKVPLLSMHIDSRKRGHQDERLEAFMYQVKECHKRKKTGILSQ